MKTNEQMLEDLIKRKEIYDKKQAVKRRRFAVISATLAVILIVSSVPVIAFAAANKKTPAPAEVTGETVTDDIVTEDSAMTVEDNDFNGDTGVVTDEKMADTDVSTISESAITIDTSPYQKHYFDIYREKIGGGSNDETLFKRETSLVSTETKIVYGVNICAHENIKEYEISVRRAEDYEGDRAYLIVIPSISVELLSDDINLLDFENNETNRIRLKFRYKDGYTNGRIDYIIYNEEDGRQFYSDINEHITNGGYGSNYATSSEANSSMYFAKLKYRICGGEALCFATIKGYDFERYNLNTTLRWIYVLAAEYFGDVDREGLPLFMNDPYMPEYYDSPDCISKREDLERPFIRIESKNTQGDLNTSNI